MYIYIYIKWNYAVLMTLYTTDFRETTDWLMFYTCICFGRHFLLIKDHYTITALCVGKHPDLSTWGGRGWQIWMFPYTEGRNCFIIFLPMFYWLSPLWGKLGCSAGNNRVVSQQHKFLPMFNRLSPLWGKFGC